MKNNILFLLLFERMSGEFTSILDSFNNTKKYLKKCNLKVISEMNKNILILKKYLPSEFEINFYNDSLNIQAETIICSAFYFFQLAKKNIFNFIKCDRLIILDSSSFIISYLDDKKIFDEIKNFNCAEKFILGNKFNAQFFNTDFYEYYHKFDFERLDKYNQIKKDEIFIKKKFYHPLEYKGMNYNREIKVKYDLPYLYYENIGKLIFEMSYLEREVNYSPKNKSFNEDGLTYYLNLFNINDNKEQILSLEKNEIVEKLGFHDNDLLLKIIK